MKTALHSLSAAERFALDHRRSLRRRHGCPQGRGLDPSTGTGLRPTPCGEEDGARTGLRIGLRRYLLAARLRTRSLTERPS